MTYKIGSHSPDRQTVTKGFFKRKKSLKHVSIGPEFSNLLSLVTVILIGMNFQIVHKNHHQSSGYLARLDFPKR